MVQLVFPGSKYLALVTSFCLFMSISVPYIIAIIKEHVRTFLPYVGHAAAFPPQSAIHSLFISLGTFFGIATVFLRFVSVELRRTRIEPPKIRHMNRAGVVMALVAFFGLMLASHFPIAFVTHEKFDWIYTVVAPNFLGSGFMFMGCTLYILTQSYLTYALRKGSDMNVSIHAVLALAVVITNWTTCLPFYAAIRSIIPKTINDSGEISLRTEEYSFYYIISSLSGWGFMVFTILFLITFYRDLKRLKVTLVLSPKPVKLDTVQPGPHTFENGEEITKM